MYSIKIKRRFYEKTEYIEGHLLWLGALDGCSYGSFWNGETVEHAHRIAWKLVYGDIPDDKHILHKNICQHPPCVNIRHLYLGTHQDNMRDTVKVGSHYFASRTHCLKGHLYDEKNTYHRQQLNGGSMRMCRSCNRERSRINRMAS